MAPMLHGAVHRMPKSLPQPQLEMPDQGLGLRKAIYFSDHSSRAIADMSDRKLFYPERFKIASHYYTSGRPTYPRALAQRIAQRVGLSRSERVLDVGTGPGFVAIDFAPLAGGVTAIDPSPEMLEIASANASQAGVAIEFVLGSSYDIGPQLGRFKLATFGRSFHWTDRAATLGALDSLLEAGGAVVLLGESYPQVPDNVWEPEFQTLIDSYATDDPARPQIKASASNETVLLESPFDALERIAVIEVRSTPVERFVDRALSFATTWHGRPGSREDDLAVEVRAAVGKHAGPDGKVREVLEGEALLAFRSRDV